MLSRPAFIYDTGEVKMAIKLNKQAMIDWNLPVYNYLSDEELKMLQYMLEPNPDKRINSETLLKLDYLKKDKANKTESLSKANLTRI